MIKYGIWAVYEIVLYRLEINNKPKCHVCRKKRCSEFCDFCHVGTCDECVNYVYVLTPNIGSFLCDLCEKGGL